MNYYKKPKAEKPDIIFGLRPVIEAIHAGKEIEKVWLKKGSQGELFQELMTLLHRQKIPFQFVPVERLNRITRKNHQGAIANISLVSYHNIEQLIPTIFENGETPLILVLDSITDVRNFGAIVRTAECAGVHAIVVPQKGAASINSDAMKTSAGALNIIPLCRVNSLRDTLMFLKNSGLTLAAANEKTDSDYYSKDLKGPLCLVMGSEDTGISPEILALSDVQLRIPIPGKIASLNVSVAAGVLLYEVVRQRSLD